MKRIGDMPSPIPARRPTNGSDNTPYGMQTKHGWFHNDDLDAAGARAVIGAGGRKGVQFPIRYDNGIPVYGPLGDDEKAWRERMAIASADGHSAVERYERRARRNREGGTRPDGNNPFRN